MGELKTPFKRAKIVLPSPRYTGMRYSTHIQHTTTAECNNLPGSVQAPYGDAPYGDGIVVVDGGIRPLDSVSLAAHDLEAGNLSGHGIVAARVVVVLVGGEYFADRHALFACRLEHLSNRA